MSTTPLPGSEPLVRFRWWVLCLLFLASVANYLDRQNLSVIQPLLRKELGITSQQYAWVLSAFMLAYAIAHPLCGRLIDRVGTKVGLLACMCWWTVAVMLHAAIGGAVSLALCRFLLGIGEAGLLPATVKAVAEWFPRSERAFAVGIVNVGIGVGTALTPPLIVSLLLIVDWRLTFILCGALNLAWVVAWQWTYRDRTAAEVVPAPAGAIAAASASDAASPSRPAVAAEQFSWTRAIRLPEVYGLMIARFLADSVWYFYLFWVPSYLVDARGFALQDIGALAWIPFVAAIAGNAFGGIVPTVLLRQGLRLATVRYGLAALAASLMPATILTAFVPAPWMALSLLSIAIFLSWVWATTLFTLPADLVPAGSVGSVFGLTGAAGSAGAILFMPFVGYLVDVVSYTPVFVIVGLLHPTAAAILLITRRRGLGSQPPTPSAAPA